MKRLVLLSLIAFGCQPDSGCGTQFTPETVVDSLRVLSITAEPPEVAPGESTTLNMLWGDPSRIGQVNTPIWVGCDPDPLDLGLSPCNDATLLIQPSLITALPEGMRILGLSGSTVTFTPARSSFDELPADSPIRQSGSVSVIVSFVIGADVGANLEGEKLTELLDSVERRETAAAIGLTRVLVSEKPVEQRNRNPVIRSLTFDGQVLPVGARLQVQEGQEIALGADITPESVETYVEQQPSGPVTKTEVVIGSWYSTGGRFNQERFDVSSPEPAVFYAPGHSQFPEDVVTQSRVGELWLVVRDNRGAQAYRAFRYHVCDSSAPTPEVTEIVQPAVAGDPLEVRGTNMVGTLDIVFGDHALLNSSYAPSRDAFVGHAPSLPPGEYPVRVRGKNFENFDTSLTYTVP